jgi:hypothetical protein
LVTLKKNCRPKEKGGLGVINLRSQNNALLLKHLDKFYNKKDISWVNLIWETYYSNGEVPHAAPEKSSFWWKDLLKLCDLFRGIPTCNLGNGQSEDNWNNKLLKETFPRIYSFARNKIISVSKFLENNDIQEQFHIPLS